MALLAGAIILTVALVGLLAFLAQRGDDKSQPSEQANSNVEATLDKSTGRDDAAVVVVEYGDFQ